MRSRNTAKGTAHRLREGRLTRLLPRNREATAEAMDNLPRRGVMEIIRYVGSVSVTKNRRYNQKVHDAIIGRLRTVSKFRIPFLPSLLSAKVYKMVWKEFDRT